VLSGQGGPPDAQLEGIFEVVAAPGAGAGGSGQGGGAGVGGSTGNEGAGGTGAQGASDTQSKGGCAMAPIEGGSGVGSMLGLLLGIAALSRRRR
jgi:hypothetical protein